MAQIKLATSADYKIEKGVPISGARGNAKYPFADMEVGDSVAGPVAIRAAAYAYGRHHNKRFSCREEGDGFRVWRTA